MSDLLALRQKIVEGQNWRKEIDVDVDGEEFTVTIRQLTDDEFFEIYPKIDIESLREFTNENEENEDEFARLQELRNKDDLTDEEEAELNALQDEVGDEEVKIIDALGDEAFAALQDAGVYAVVPDKEDIDAVMDMSTNEQKELFDGEIARTREQAKHMLESDIENILENSVDLVAFNVGLTAFFETIGGDEGN